MAECVDSDVEERAPSVVYSADSRREAGLCEALHHTAGSIIAYRWQIVQSFKRDFLNLSSLTRWGALWNYVLPLAPLGVYIMLTSIRAFPSFSGVEAAVYITMGVTLWYLFSGLIRNPISILEADFRSISRANMPIGPALVAGVSQLVFETALRSAVVAVVFGFLQGSPSWKIVFVPPLLLAASLFFGGVGVCLALFNLAYRDISKIVGITLTYGIFFSGVLFPLPSGAISDFALAGNPFYVFIENIRALSIGLPLESPLSLMAFSIAGIGVFALAILLSYRTELSLRGLV